MCMAWKPECLAHCCSASLVCFLYVTLSNSSARYAVFICVIYCCELRVSVTVVHYYHVGVIS